MKGDELRSLSVIFLLITTTTLILFSIPDGLPPIKIVGTSNASFAGGDGTAGNPYQISDVFQLQEMGTDLDAHYLFVNDIDASDTINWNSGEGFDPIGNLSSPFTGSLNGSSYNISDLHINTPSKDHRGIFGMISDGSILSNINSINTDITGQNYVGGLVGRKDGGNVINCTISGNLIGNNKVGGLIGYNSGEVENCHSTCEVNASNDVGGLIGDNFLGNITYCSASGDIDGDKNFIGGLIGWNNLGGKISFSYATGNVGGNLSGYSRGGLLGYNAGGAVFFSFATGDTSGNYDVGGLVGQNEADGLIENCYATGDVESGWPAGGLVGAHQGTISNCYSTGRVDPADRGGLAGHPGSSTYNSFWNVDTSFENRSYGGTALNDSEMRTGSIFRYAGWDMINIWGIFEGRSYPYLIWHEYPGVPEIVTEDDIDAVEDSPYQNEYKARSSLPGGGGAFWSMRTDATNWLTLDPSGLLHGTPSNEDVGSYWVNITARLFDDGFDFHNFTISVDNLNNAPVILSVELPSAREDDPYFFTIEAMDIDPTSDQLSWTISTNASFLKMESNAGHISGIPGNDDIGTYWVLINVSDGNGGSDELNLTLTVLNSNDDPRILPFDIPDIFEDEYFSIDLEAEDIDPTGDILSWSMETEASFIILDPETSTLSGLPRNEDVGIWGVTVEVYDGKGGSDLAFFSLDVNNINDDPVITTNSLPDGLEDEHYSITLQGYDLDPTMDVLLFQIMETNGDFLNIDPVENILSGLPENDDVGTWWVNITVSDGNGGYDWRNLTLNILAVNDAPYLNVTDLLITMEEDSMGYALDLDDIFIDEEGDLLSFDLSGSDHISGSVNGNTLTLVPERNWFGWELINFTATDGEYSISIIVNVTVTPVNDPPFGAHIFAEETYVEGQDQFVYLTVSDPDLPFADQLTFTWSSNVTGEIGDGYSINLSLPVGHYNITVTVTDIGGLTTTHWVEIEVIPDDSGETSSGGKDKLDMEKLIGFFIIGFLIGLVFIFILLRRKKKFGSLTEDEVDENLDELLEEILEE